ncbi:helix-turn-helix domain-containing protein [Miltoncostaea oceani]|uniref:helix-turn-helix domain-containing protein n=1 Tax=Miltoncostaea oceani TaxID=2843216 RepID=UPI001C3DB3A3|nr:GAF domain-containing protein [Miltoncostaea oceani]
MARDPEIAFLQRLALTAASASSMGELVRLVISETAEALETDVCSVYLLDPDDGLLVLTATNGLSHEGVGRVRLALGEGVTGAAAADRRPVVVADVRREPRFRWLDGVDQARFVSMCSVPILAGDRLVGVLNVQTDRTRIFSEGDVAFLTAIAAQVAGVLARVELQERLERRVADLGRSEEVHRRLSGLVLAGAGLRAVCDEIAGLTGAAVAVYDLDGVPVATSGTGLPGRLPGGGAEGGLEVATLSAGRETLGWLAVGPSRRPGDIGRRQALEHGATVLALELVRERAADEARHRASGDLIDELLSAGLAPDDADRLAERAARLGHRLQGPAWVIAIEGDDARSGHALTAPAARVRAARELSGLAMARDADAIVVERLGGIALIVSGLVDGDAAEVLAGGARAVAAALAPGGSVSCGLSGEAGGPAALHRLSLQARQALRVARRLGERGVVASYRRLGIERLLLAIDDPEPIDGFVEDWIGPLVRHDEAGRGGAAPLLESLDALVREGWNMRATARRLGVHVNTLLYRMRRIETLVRRRLDDPDTRLALALALRARVVAAGSPGPAVSVLEGEPPVRAPRADP